MAQLQKLLLNKACISCLQNCTNNSCSLIHTQRPLVFIRALPLTTSTIEDIIYKFMKKITPTSEFRGAILQGPNGHFWPAESAFLDKKDGEKETIMLFHIDHFHFTFRIFDTDGCEKNTSKFLSPNCLCCKIKKTVTLPSQDATLENHNRKDSTANTKLLQMPSFTVFLPRLAVARDYRVRVPWTFVREWMPYECKETLLVVDVNGKKTPWIVGFYANYKNKDSGICKGWRDVVRANMLEQGDKCLFVLVDKINPYFEVLVSKKPRE